MTSDIDKMSLQEKKCVPSTTGKAKKMRVANDNENGLLFTSLTNSIFQILVENQTKVESPTVTTSQDSTEYSPMEQLLMKPFDPTLGKMSVEMPEESGEHQQFQFSTQTSPGQNITVINIISNPVVADSVAVTTVNQLPVQCTASNSTVVPVVNNNVMATRKGSDSDNSLSSSTQSVMSSKGSNPNSPYALQVGSAFGSMSSPGEASLSPGYVPSPSSSTSYSEQMLSQPSPIECLLMSPPFAAQMPGPQSYLQNDLALQGKLKAFEEQQIVPGGEYVGRGLDDIENMRSVYITDDSKVDENLMPSSVNENGLTDEEECDFFSDVEAELNEDGITLDDLDIQLLEFNRFQCPIVKNNITREEKEAIITHLSKLAIKLQGKYEIMTCEEIKTRHKAYLVSTI